MKQSGHSGNARTQTVKGYGHSALSDRRVADSSEL